MQAGGSLENCEKTWLLKKAGINMTPELAKLIKELGKTKSVDTLEYNDGDLERFKNDFGVDLIIEKLNKVDGICNNNKNLAAENKKIKDDLVAMQGIYEVLQASWLKKAEARKLELKEVLSKNYKVSDDFLKEKELDELEDYLKLVKMAKDKAKDDGVKLTPEEQRKIDMNDKSDGVEILHDQGGIINDFEGYIDRKMEIVKKEKFGYGVGEE